MNRQQKEMARLQKKRDRRNRKIAIVIAVILACWVAAQFLSGCKALSTPHQYQIKAEYQNGDVDTLIYYSKAGSTRFYLEWDGCLMAIKGRNRVACSVRRFELLPQE